MDDHGLREHAELGRELRSARWDEAAARWILETTEATYRARFVIRRWLAPAVEVRLPGPLAGPAPEFLRDGKKVDPTPVPGTSGADRLFRVPLPEPRPGLVTVVEVRYQLPAGRGDSTYHPPLLPSAAFAGPVRWQVSVPAGAVPLDPLRCPSRPTLRAPTPSRG